jgi:urease accessory protein
MSVLQLFKALPVARELVRGEALPPHARDYRRETITLGWEERIKIRSRRVSDRGFEFGTALPRGTVLRAGDSIVLDDAKTVVAVVERPEAVFVIEPATPHEWGVFAYHIGNNHQPLMVSDGALVCPDVPGMQQLLEQHGIAFCRATRPFTPVGSVPDHRH